MNFKRMLYASLIAYAVTFVIGMLIGLIFPFDLANPTPLFWVLTILATILAVTFASFWYFKSQGTIKEGAYLGISMLVVGFILDLIILIPVWTTSFDLLLTYYASYWFLVAIFFVVAIPIIVAKIKEQ